jgi:(p)ppGpp synthase/HD superfamily hydrolase
MTMTLDQALIIAIRAHAGQTDKIGNPYIWHPLRIMLRMSSTTERIAAILHDVVEDSPITLADLGSAGCPAKVLKAVDCLTRRKGERYEDYVHRAAADRLAKVIKIADLEDNMELRLKNGLAGNDKARMARYRKAYLNLTGVSYRD